MPTGYATLVNTAETAWHQVRKRIFLRHFILKTIVLPRQARDKHKESTQKEMFCFVLQGVDLYSEAQDRLIAGAEFHASILLPEPAPFRQPVPKDVCGGKVKGNAPSNYPPGTKLGGTWSMLARHFVTRKGLTTMPNTTALVPLMVGSCWDQMCWEILSHSFTPPNKTKTVQAQTKEARTQQRSAHAQKTDDAPPAGAGAGAGAGGAPWPLRTLPVTTGGAGRPTVKLTDFGGKADGVTDNLPAFKKAFAKLASTSGGTLIVPRLNTATPQTDDSSADSDGNSGSGGEEAVYMTLPLYITQSNLTLVIEEGVRLKAKTDTVLSHAGAESEHHFVSSSFTGVVFVPSVSCKSSFCIHASSEHPPTKRLGCFW